MVTVPTITLNNGVEIPQLGFGTYQIPPEETKDAVTAALEVGYRHIDTAEMYGNEVGVGEAVRASGIDRSEIFVTSKLNNGHHAYDDALAAFDRTIEDLGLEHLDLFLIHWPMPEVLDYVDTWKAMEEIARSGRCRAIGVSNFQPKHLQRLADETDTTPAVNQIEIHPYFAQSDVRKANADLGVATEAWSPIAQGDVLGDETLEDIGGTHSKSAPQVALRWHLQRGDIIFPKTVKRERMEQNFALFDFSLSDEEMARVDGLDRGERKGPHPDEKNS